MRSLLVIFVCALVINSQATTLTEKRDHQLGEISRKPPSGATALPTGAADYNRRGTLPVAAPKPGKPSLIEIITTRSREHNIIWIMKNYGRDEHELAPPSPKEAPPTHQVTTGGAAAEETEQNKLGKLKFYVRDKPKRAPPAPKEEPPTHQVTGGGAAALENFGKEGGEVLPPALHHAPSTHQVAGVVTDGGVEAQENYGKEGGQLAPPPPHHAPPTHEVSGGGATEMEESWAYVLLSASA